MGTMHRFSFCPSPSMLEPRCSFFFMRVAEPSCLPPLPSMEWLSFLLSAALVPLPSWIFYPKVIVFGSALQLETCYGVVALPYLLSAKTYLFPPKLAASSVAAGPCSNTHKRNFLPFLGMWYNCFWKNYIPFRHKFQVKDPLGMFTTWRFLKVPPKRYFFHSTWLTKWLHSENSFHKNFPPIERFVKPLSLVCRPPSNMGLLTMSHLTSCSLFFFPLSPLHRKYRISLDILSMTAFGARRSEDWYIGRAARIDLIIISSPASMSHFPPQEAIFSFILLTTSSQREGLFCLKVKERAKYLIYSQISNLENSKRFAKRIHMVLEIYRAPLTK